MGSDALMRSGKVEISHDSGGVFATAVLLPVLPAKQPSLPSDSDDGT